MANDKNFKVKNGLDTGSTITTPSHGTSANWKSAYDYSQVDHLPLSGGTLTGELIIDTSTNNYFKLYTEGNTTTIADTFAGNTDKSYIYFYATSGSNDPGYIMHETRSGDDANEGVLHLVPSDDNSAGDYVSIHGTNDADVLKLHTSGLVETASNYQLTLKSGSGSVKIDDNLQVYSSLEVVGHSLGNLNETDDIGQALEYGNAACATLRFDSDRWRLWAGGASGVGEAFTVLETGNVGIGYSTPASITSKLTVSGGITATGDLSIANITASGNLSATGTLSGSGYNDSNWNTAYSNHLTDLSFSEGTLTASKQTGTETVSLDGRYLKISDFSTTLDDSYATVKKATVSNVNAGSYVRAFRVEGDRLAAAVKATFRGTSDNVVVNVTAEILVNHSEDIIVKTTSGFYTVLTIKVVSDDNDDFDVSIKHNGTTNTAIDVEVLPLGSQTVTMAPTATAYSGASLVHVADYGVKYSSDDNGGTGLVDFQTDGKITGKDLDIESTATNGIQFTETGDTAGNTPYNHVYIRSTPSGSDSLTADRIHTALYVDLDSSASGGNGANDFINYGIYVDARNQGEATTKAIYGRAEAENSAGTNDNLIGVDGIAIADESGTARTTNVKGIRGIAYGRGTGSGGDTVMMGGDISANLDSETGSNNVQTLWGMRSEINYEAPSNGQSYAPANAYVVGAVFDDNSIGKYTTSNSYLFYGDYQIASGTGSKFPTNAYGLYLTDSDADVVSFIGHNLGIGDNTPEEKLTVSGNIKNTGSIEYGTSLKKGNSIIIDSSQNLTITGTITASGYDDSNWDTAYTYSQVGHLPLTGGTLTGSLTLDSYTGTAGNDDYTTQLSANTLTFASHTYSGQQYTRFYHGAYTGYYYFSSNSSTGLKDNIRITSAGNSQSSTNAIHVHNGTDWQKVWHRGDLTATNKSNYDTAYGWGDHSQGGYLTSFDITTQTDNKYLRSDVADTAAERITFDKGINVGGHDNGGIFGNNYNISGVNQITINDPGEGIIWDGTNGAGNNVSLYVIDDANDNIVNIANATELRVNNSKVWTAGNDGTGSGLDADTVDGIEGANFLRSDVSDSYFRINQRTHGVPSNNLGTPSITEMALFQEQFNNKTAFYDITKLKFFTSTDGTNYTEYTSFSDDNKKKFLGGDNNSSVIIPNDTPHFRIELENDGDYVYLNALYMYWSSQSHSTTVKTSKYHNANGWTTHTTSNTTVSSWPGHLYLPFDTIAFHPTSSTRYSKIRIDFEPTWSTGDYTDRDIALYRMQIWGGYPAGKQTIYGVDENKKVTFPGSLKAGNIDIASSSIGQDEAGLLFQPNSAYRCIHPTSMTSTAHSSDISLGWSNNKWKDVYLAGFIKADSGYQVGTTTVIDSSRNLTVASATTSGDINVGDGSSNARILIKKADNNLSDHIQFYNGTTRIGEIGSQDDTWLRINQVTAKNIYTPRYIRADSGFFVDDTTKGINGSGNFIGGTITGASDANVSNWNDAYTYSQAGHATESYVDTAVSNLVDSAPGALNTLNELAAALGDDASFSTTITTSIGTKLPKAGGSMTGALDITVNGPQLFLKSATNAGDCSIKFSSLVNGTSDYNQFGTLGFYHANASSYGSDASFVLGSNQNTTTILADGKLMYNEGIYSKPASGTGAGTRKDANWDSAYTYSGVGHVEKAGDRMTGVLEIAGTGTNSTYDADDLVLSGFGVIGNRSAPVYITNSNAAGTIKFGVGGAHNANVKLTVTGSTVQASQIIKADAGLSVLSGTGGGKLRIRRNANSTDGDDITDLHMDDGSLYFDIDNDNDGDGGQFVFRRKVNGSMVAATIKSGGDTVLTTASTGINAATLDSQDKAYYRNATNLNAGTVNSVRLPEATAANKGAIELWSDTEQAQAAAAVSNVAGRTYGLQLNSNGQGVVNVPWRDVDFVAVGNPTLNDGSGSSITTAELFTEIEGLDVFDYKLSSFKTSWDYAGNDNLSDGGGLTELAGTSWLNWTDNSSDSTRGNITSLVIAPNTGDSAGGVFIYNDQGSGYSPGWREVWTSRTDGAGSGLDADMVDGIQSSRIIYGSNSSGTNEKTVTDWNSVSKSGFYSDDDASNRFGTSANWSSILHHRLYDANNNYGSQLGFDTYKPELFYRMENNTTWSAWDQIITERQLALSMGWLPAYSNTNLDTIRYNAQERAVEITDRTLGSADTEIGASYRAMKVKGGQTYRVSIQVKGDVADSNGLYLRVYHYQAATLPDGKTSVGHSTSHAEVQATNANADEDNKRNWHENSSITTAWKTYTVAYEPVNDGWASINVLNFSGYAGESVYVRNPHMALESGGGAEDLFACNIYATNATIENIFAEYAEITTISAENIDTNVLNATSVLARTVRVASGTVPAINGTTLSGGKGALLNSDGDFFVGDPSGAHMFFDQDQGKLNIRSATTGGRIEFVNDTIKVLDSSGNERVILGNIS